MQKEIQVSSFRNNDALSMGNVIMARLVFQNGDNQAKLNRREIVVS